MTAPKPNAAVLGIWSRLLLLVGGLAAGYAWASYQAKPSHSPAPDVNLSQETVPVAQPVERQTDASALARATTSECKPAMAVAKTPARQESLPPGREPTTLAGWYEAFMSEPRDNAWAPVIESDIRDIIAASGNTLIQPEYVACASSRCTVAGLVDQTSAFDSCVIGSWLGDALIFRDAFSYTCIDEDAAGKQRFVVFVDSERAP